MRGLAWTIGGLVALGLLFVAWCFAEARRDPVVRRADIALPRWPAGASPVRAVLVSDVHIGSLAMDAHRLNRIVTQINALDPDLVLIAGDFIAGHAPDGAARSGEALVAPLGRLKARFGVFAVPGNHDHWTGLARIRDQLARAHVRVLQNQAVAAGPLALGGVDDDFSGHADVAATMRGVRALPGAPLLLTHSPDVAPDLPADAPLLFAGHTHCGQVVLPFHGPVNEVSRYGPRYRCGLVREGWRTVIVTAGLGTSGGPFRLNAPPDLWLVTLRGAPAGAAAAR